MMGYFILSFLLVTLSLAGFYQQQSADHLNRTEITTTKTQQAIETVHYINAINDYLYLHPDVIKNSNEMVLTAAQIGISPQNMNSSEATDAKARQQIQKLTSPSPVLREAARQWVNPTPIMDRTAIKKATPPCTLTLHRQGPLSLHDVSERITRVCRLPVSVTPDALTLLGGVSGGPTQQMTGDIPPPDVNGMVPLAAIGRASSSATAAVNPGATLNGLYWNGPLAGLLDTIASRLGVSWRYESGQIVIYALETRSLTLNFMDSQTDYQSRVVSGTTSLIT